MTADSWADFQKLLSCAALVASVVLPCAVVFAWLGRRLQEPLVPRIRPWPVPWSGLDVGLLLAFGVLLPPVVGETLTQTTFFETIYGVKLPAGGVSPPSESASASAAGAAAASIAHEQLLTRQIQKGLWAGVIALPMQIGAILLLRTALYPAWRSRTGVRLRELPSRIGLAGFAWLVLTPAVFLVHFAASYLSSELGSSPDDHPLTKLGAGSVWLDRILLVFQACLAAPLMEEWLCRGILLPWATRRSERITLILAVAIGLALLFGSSAEVLLNRIGTAVFLTIVFAVWALANLGPPSLRGAVRRRRWGGMIASASLFAALHTTVWPSPVPLFVLGLGLGWLALATRGILVPVLVHALFNGVSVLFVLDPF